MSFFGVSSVLASARNLGRWIVLLVPLALMIGSACSLFLRGLDFVTSARFSHPNLLFLLPLSGVAVAFCYQKFGAGSEGGNNLLLDAVHRAHSDHSEPNALDLTLITVVPRRMAPLILGATLLTHLCGGSAGREGTALQMGGALASAWGQLFKLQRAEIRILLLCGIAAGFGGVFGTPLAGAVFALEVLTIGRLQTGALGPCLLAALLSNWSVAAWGVHHTRYLVADPTSGTHFDPVLALKIGLAAIIFGLVAALFAKLMHGVARVFKNAFKNPLHRPFVGGIVVIALTMALGTRDYLGLGVSSPVVNPVANAVTLGSAFESGGAAGFSWAWKLVFTVVTLGSGFKGGEVTPLFFIGATLGNALSGPLHAPVSLMAAAGFIAVFAGATNTPLACTLLGIELFGAPGAPYFAIACFSAQIWSGQGGIYTSQRQKVAAI